MYSKLFSPIKIKEMQLKNRIILPAMGTKFAGNDRMVNQQLIDYHVDRVKGGSGLNIVEVTSVHPLSSPRRFLAIGEDKYISGFKKLTDAIHEAGGKAGIQLWQGSLAVSSDKAAQILVASDMPISKELTIPGVTIEQIKEIINCYGDAARRSVEAGFDCIEVHVAHNYLPHSFLSPGLNHRTDEYGGSFENRAKFPLEVIKAVKANIPDNMPILMRIDAHDDYLQNGLTIEEVIEFCKLAKEARVDVLDISRGNIITAALKFEVPPIDLPQGFNIDNASRIRKETGMLTIGVGRINTPDLAEQILEANKVDMVVMGRAQLADPEFCNKAEKGLTDDIDYCVGCNQGCFDGFADANTPHITCLRNPALGREAQCRIIPTEKSETVLIAGGGLAGLEAAIILKERGHNPILCEASERLGGQFILAGEAPRKSEMKVAVLSMAKKAERIGIDIRLSTPVDKILIESVKPHTVINSIGSDPLIPNIKGIDRSFVVNSHEVLSGKADVRGNVVVIGGGLVGVEAAEYLAEKGAKVTIVEMLKEFASDLGGPRKICVTENVYATGIVPATEVKVTEIKENLVVGVRNGVEVTFPCDYAVIALGAKSRCGKEIENACRENGIAYFVAGDAAKARRGLNATREAFDIAMTFDNEQIHRDAVKRPKVVFITGGTGIMGQETIKQLLSRGTRFKVRALARPSEKNKEVMKNLDHPNLEVIWGDMVNYDTILKGVTGADYVLHIGAMVSPMADKYPKDTLYTNIGSTLNIIKAIKAQPNVDDIKFAYVGTVAMTGSRLEPIHWGRVGDPINPSIHDYYGMSKVFSEQAVFDSGLKHWVSIRQTGQHPCNEASANQPIVFHQPPNNVLEWSTSIESGICMANLCEDWVPEDFWRKAYNLSSGSKWRLTTWEFMNLNMLGLGARFEDVYDPRQQALFNFHGQWYTDADILEEKLHFRCVDFNQYWAGVKAEIDALKANPMISAMLPTAEQMKVNNEMVGHMEMGFHWMFENNEEDWIKAFFGSKEKQSKIKSYEEGYELYRPSEEMTYLYHGYNEKKSLNNLTIKELNEAAEFRGGQCLAEEVKDIYEPITWQCAFGHQFKSSVNAVLHGGHWCSECLRYEWHYDEIANNNPFYAQFWKATHGEGDDYKIPMKFSAFDIMKDLKNTLNMK